MNIKLCKDCKNYEHILGVDFCTIKFPTLVTGKKYVVYFCKKCRSPKGICGIDAIYYAPKLFKRINDYIFKIW